MMAALAFHPARSTSSTEAGEYSNSTVTMLSDSFTILDSSEGNSKPCADGTRMPIADSMRLAVTGLRQLDGEYLLVAKSEPEPTATTSTTMPPTRVTESSRVGPETFATKSTMQPPTRATESSRVGPATFLGSASYANGKADAILTCVVAGLLAIAVVRVV
jgi:hypothetical protein